MHQFKKIIVFCLVLLILISSSVLGEIEPALALESSPPPTAALSSNPKTCRIGVYLLSLGDFNLTEKSFGADFWIWSVCPSKDLKPLDSLELVNAKNIEANYNMTEEKKDKFGPFNSQNNVHWSQKKIRANFHHDWNVENFPFDKHTLKIPIEESGLTASDFVYTADSTNSSYKTNMRVDGWKVKKFLVSQQKETYQSTFGDPELKSGSSDYTRLLVTISIERDSILSFFKILTGVYAAFGTTLLAFFLDPGENFGDRSALLVGSLFAVLVSMQGIENILGKSESITMVDAIHVTTLIYILVAVAAAVYSLRLCEDGLEKKALRFDRQICFSLFTISFAVFNSVMIINALVNG